MPNRKFTMDPWLSLDKVFNNFNHLIHQNEAGVGPKVHSCKTEDELMCCFSGNQTVTYFLLVEISYISGS